mgnify:CR=1 FL=1
MIPQEEWLELIKTAKAKSRIVKLLDKKEKLNDKYPIENIPEEYIILLDLDIKK